MKQMFERLTTERTLWHDGAYKAVAAVSVGAILFVLATGAYLGSVSGTLWSGGFEGPAADRAIGLVATTPVWLNPVGLAGLAGLMVAVAIVLRRIIATITLRRDALMLLGTAPHDEN